MKKSLLLALITLFTLPELLKAQNEGEPPFNMSKIAAYSIFTDAVRSNDFDMAVQFGEWMLVSQPREIEGVTTFRLDRQFQRIIGVYTTRAGNEPDPTEKSNLLSRAEEILLKTFDVFEEDEIDLFAWYQRAGRFYQEHHSNLDTASSSTAFDWYERAYQLDPEAFIEEADGFFARILLTFYVSSGERDKALEMIEELEAIASPELMADLDQFREQLFESPEERITFLESRLDGTEGEEREMMMQQLIDLYDETRQRDKAIAMARELYDMNPNFSNTRRVADSYLSDGNYRDAIPFLEEMVDQAPTDAETGSVLLELAEAHQQLGDLREARDVARRATNHTGSAGQAYFRIHSIYAAAITQCTGGQALDRDDRTVYWLVIDYLERAKNADSSLRSQADRRIQSFREAMPRSEDRFFRGWEPGDSFRIDGNLKECYAWIDETTTVKE